MERGSAAFKADLSLTAVCSKMKITGKDINIYMYNNPKIKTISRSSALSINTDINNHTEGIIFCV